LIEGLRRGRETALEDAMLKDLTRSDWLSILNIPEERIPVALILRGTRNLKTQYGRHRRYFDNVLEVGTPNSVLEDVLIGDLDGRPVAYASVYGAPMASEVVHVFGVLGTPLVIQTGCCGALAEGIGPGDLFAANEAVRGEGASQYYEPAGEIVSASLDLREWPPAGRRPDVALHTGRIYTTSALFAEGMEDVEAWYRAGCAAVDMETAATFAVAAYFHMDRASLLFAFDNPRQRDHIFLDDAQKENLRAAGNKRMIEWALAAVRAYSRTHIRRTP
jgi:uridine phosphorylase